MRPSPRDEIIAAKDFGWFCTVKHEGETRYWQLTYLPKRVVEPAQMTSSTRLNAVRHAIERYTKEGLSEYALATLREMIRFIPPHESIFHVAKTALTSKPWHVSDETPAS